MMGSAHHPPTPSSKEEGEQEVQLNAPSSEQEGEPISKAPSSLEEGVGGGGVTRQVLLARAAAMRKNLPEPERRLWMQLRDRRFCGFKFRRQTNLEHRIVDFFCPDKGLVIEIDGDTHDPVRDQVRDAGLSNSTGFRVVRFRNEDVMRNIDGVLLALKIVLDEQRDRWPGRRLHHPPTPSSKDEGEKLL